jgi:hypothetical protein
MNERMKSVVTNQLSDRSINTRTSTMDIINNNLNHNNANVSSLDDHTYSHGLILSVLVLILRSQRGCILVFLSSLTAVSLFVTSFNADCSKLGSSADFFFSFFGFLIHVHVQDLYDFRSCVVPSKQDCLSGIPNG